MMAGFRSSKSAGWALLRKMGTCPRQNCKAGRRRRPAAPAARRTGYGSCVAGLQVCWPALLTGRPVSQRLLQRCRDAARNWGSTGRRGHAVSSASFRDVDRQRSGRHASQRYFQRTRTTNAHCQSGSRAAALCLRTVPRRHTMPQGGAHGTFTCPPSTRPSCKPRWTLRWTRAAASTACPPR
jgi:hypothetical protein